MKKILLLALSVVFVGALNAQVIFSGESPASIQGAYEMEYAEPAGGWGVPDLLDPANAVLDTLAQFLDTSTADSLGCLAAANPGDVQDKIAILYRGDCEFGTKALNAQNAGAIACVIINNEPGGPVGMAPGSDGANVTIPLVMISDVDGATLINEMQNGPVEVFIGNKTGFYPNDVGTDASAVLRPEYAVTPALIAQDDTEYSVDLGAWVYNFGFQDQTNVNLSAKIDYNGTEIYNDTATAVDIVSSDSSYFTLETFSQPSYGTGKYELTYTVMSDSADAYSFDNTYTTSFHINDSLLTYASLTDSSGLPSTSGGFRPGGTAPTYSSCMAFRDENASRIAPEGITFSAIKGADANIPSMEGEAMLVIAYEWNDQFTDLNDQNFGFNSLDEITFAEYTYPSDLSGEPVTGYFDDAFALEDNQRYLFCVQTFNEEIYIGFDPEMDYTTNVNTYAQPICPVEADGSYTALGFGADRVSGVTVNVVDAVFVNLENEAMNIDMNAYPSPVSSTLNIDFSGHDVEKIELVSLAGRKVSEQAIHKGVEQTKVDVSGFDNGVYIVNVKLENGLTKTMQVVVSH
ncbi:MAG: PA domain-containing protein [Bacteroidota bacterium]